MDSILELVKKVRELMEADRDGRTATEQGVGLEVEAVWVLDRAKEAGIVLLHEARLKNIARRHFIGHFNALLKDYADLDKRGCGGQKQDYWRSINDKLSQTDKYYLSQTDMNEILQAVKKLCLVGKSP